MAEQQQRVQLVVHNPPSFAIPSFGGTDKEDFERFARQLESSLEVTNTPVEQRARLLHLHLTGGALLFFDTLAENVRNRYAEAVRSLRNRYSNPNRVELHRITFSNRKYNASTESAEDFLADISRVASLAFPDDLNAEGEIAVNRGEERANRIRERFVQGMPFKMKRHLLNAPDHETVQQLCDRVTKRVFINRVCPEDDGVGAFNALSEQNEEFPKDNVVALLELFHTQQEARDKEARQQQQAHQDARDRKHDAALNLLADKLAATTVNTEKPVREKQQNENQQSRGGYRDRGGHRDRGGYRGRGRGQNRDGQTQVNRSTVCYNCSGFGHMSRECPTQKTPQRNQTIPYQQQQGGRGRGRGAYSVTTTYNLPYDQMMPGQPQQQQQQTQHQPLAQPQQFQPSHNMVAPQQTEFYQENYPFQGMGFQSGKN